MKLSKLNIDIFIVWITWIKTVCCVFRTVKFTKTKTYYWVDCTQMHHLSLLSLAEILSVGKQKKYTFKESEI